MRRPQRAFVSSLSGTLLRPEDSDGLSRPEALDAPYDQVHDDSLIVNVQIVERAFLLYSISVENIDVQKHYLSPLPNSRARRPGFFSPLP